jgi:ABC-type transport system involved in cytochrome c biogenesis ATPase subunit
MEPAGWTGGRIYLRMIYDVARRIAPVVTPPDLKRGYPRRRCRKMRHLAALAPAIHALRDARGVFVWDDLSLLWFTPAMRHRTIFVFHHHDPLHYDSAPIEPLLWQALFAALRQCATVVCVSPYWAAYLAANERGRLRERSISALSEVGLSSHARAWPVTLSGGEAQRVALARALVREPQLMLLDEPFGALDALTRARMHRLLQDLCARHRPAVLLVTHDVDEAILLADRVLVLTNGAITVDLPVRLDRPRERGRAEFTALRTRLLEELGAAAELCRDWELGRFVLGSRSGCSGYQPCWAGSGRRACSAAVVGCRRGSGR